MEIACDGRGDEVFTYDDMRNLLTAPRFVPFRLCLTDGGFLDVRHREFVTAGRRYAVVGLPDSADPDNPFDRHTVVYYLHVSRAETLTSGPPPINPPAPPSGPAPPQTPA